MDSGGDTALHIACREGHLQVVRTLLEESQLNAETMNLKGQNPLHVLARHGKDNSAAICEFFIECMPDYPINKPDLDGNTGKYHYNHPHHSFSPNQWDGFMNAHLFSVAFF